MIRNPYTNGRAKRQRTQNIRSNSSDNHHHNRCVLLFDMDCFYAQCERVRLGLPMDVKLCLFQWNSVLAVTYPAREYGIKRGDSWDDVGTKMKTNKPGTCNNNIDDANNECYTIHLPILGHEEESQNKNNSDETNKNKNKNINEDITDDSIEASYKRIFELSKEEQLNCQKKENGRRRFHHQGKACLERYRLASMRIFADVLESLQKRITHERGYNFVLERASIDEFYLDLTDYCYQRNQSKDFGGIGTSPNNNDNEWRSKTVVAGRKSPEKRIKDYNTDDPLELALNRASEISYWIRQDIWKILGFTMSAGISTNKTMAKLAASYGKPNGQAVLYPSHFHGVLSETKITKVRNFGGKLGKTALKLLVQYQKNEQPWNTPTNESDADALDRLKSTATMADLNQIPLPFLIQSKQLSKESAQFVFRASQGVDHEEVKETSGALVKSITAFKSFTATKSHAEIFDRWLNLLGTEIVERVARDTTRNKRYPKSCTLNYTYYTTPNGQRPSAPGSTRSQRQSRSLRLKYPSEREGTKQQKSAFLLAQTKEKLIPIVKDHPLRGVGLSVSNFIASTVHHQTQEGSIQSFFAAEQKTNEERENSTQKSMAERKNPVHSKHQGAEHFPLVSSETTAVPAFTKQHDPNGFTSSNTSKSTNSYHMLETATKKTIATLEDKDFDYARKLQASFDRENYVLSTANRRRENASNVKKNTQRIDSFFKKR